MNRLTMPAEVVRALRARLCSWENHPARRSARATFGLSEHPLAGWPRLLMLGVVTGGLFWSSPSVRAVPSDLSWPEIYQEAKPWVYWWWPASAVDSNNLTRELQRYRDAGLGGVHIIPIYGVKGWEEKFIEYLSPKWMEMLGYTVSEARRLGLGVDMTTGTGWCFGGPNVAERDANAVTKDGVTQRPTMKVKRAGPGGEGWMLNPFYSAAMSQYLERFTAAFAGYNGLRPRAMYHDSYEYKANWSPDLLKQFEQRRGYRLQNEFPALFGKEENDHVARVKSDYRETLSDMMVEEAWPVWTRWAREHGFLTRNEAHGSPGNLLDLYALADIPETEMFHTDRNKFVSKFASSAAHVAGRKLVAAETGTWLEEHFNETLGGLKMLMDDMFLSGVNHVFYHGCCYSPDEAAWPGWLFYAATEMNPRNAIWRDVPALNAYIARCQAILQSGRPDNDVLLYWPVYDLWHNPKGMNKDLTVHARDWLEGQAIGRISEQLWQRGFGFDYVSDRQLQTVRSPRVIVVPPCNFMPETTLVRLFDLAREGATVIFADHLPSDVPGFGRLEQRREVFHKTLGGARPSRVLVGDLEKQLTQAGVVREALVDQPGLQFIRRVGEGGLYHYFIANRGEQALDSWVPLATPAASVLVMDPLTGDIARGAVRENKIYLQLPPGASVLLRVSAKPDSEGPTCAYWKPVGDPSELTGTWRVTFIQGGPELPSPFQSDRLVSWTAQGGEAERFAGVARYTLRFDAPPRGELFQLDLGRVCESARVRLNDRHLGTLIMPPWRIAVDHLKPKDNVLEVEVTNLSANRIRDLDRRKVSWKNFYDINLVNMDYKPFDASNWPVRDSGLLGPVRLIPVAQARP